MNKYIKKRILTFGLILLTGIITSFINSFSSLAIILFAPGILLGLAVTIPHFDKSRKQIIALSTLPLVMTLLWFFCLGIGLIFGIVNNSYDDKTGVIFLGLISSFLFAVIIDLYYPISNKIFSYSTLIVLGITSTLLCDYLFLEPNSKELNLGKMILIWEILVGLGLTIFVEFDWNNKNESKNE